MAAAAAHGGFWKSGSSHDVRGTWIICGATVEKYPQISRAVKKAGHAIAGHTYEHEMMCNYPPDQELQLIKKTVSVFQDQLGEQLRGWRTCFASHNTIDLLLEHFDFEWDASIWNDDLPYMIEGHGKRLLEIPFSSYSDAAWAIQITNPMPPTPYGTWHSNTPEFIFAHPQGAVRRALRTRRRQARPDAADGARLHRRTAVALEGARPVHSLRQSSIEGVVFATHDQVSEWWLRNYAERCIHTPARRA